MDQQKKELLKEMRKKGRMCLSFCRMGEKERAKRYKEEYDNLWFKLTSLKEFGGM